VAVRLVSVLALLTAGASLERADADFLDAPAFGAVFVVLAVFGFFSGADFELLERTILIISLVGRQADLWLFRDTKA
jgi:hypothetical protein